MKKMSMVKMLALAAILTVFSASPAGTFSAYADEIVVTGPASDPALTSRTGTESTQDTVITQDADLLNKDYYDVEYTNSIVQPVDKYSFTQMETDLKALAAAYPETMQLQVIGQSYEGRNLYCAVIGSTDAPKKILFQGAMHAREYMSVPILMKQIETLLQGAKAGALYNGTKVSDLLNQVCFYYVPMINPDGVTISQSGEEGATDEVKQILQDAYARDKENGVTSASYEEYLKRWKANARGVDLNNNWDSGSWSGGNGYPRSQGYRGTEPLSEPETQALAQLTRDVHFDAAISYHNMGDIIYWDTANNLASTASKEMADIINKATHYAIMDAKGYGGFKDWLQSRSDDPVPGITIEIGQSAAPVDFSEYPVLWQQNRVVPGLIADYVINH